MSAFLQFLETTLNPLILVFTVSNLAAMGLQVKMPDVLATLKNIKALTLIFVWGWILGPVVGLLITKLLPLMNPT